MRLIARYIVTAFLILIALPAFAGAGETIKNVFVNNTPEDPVPVQGIGTQQVTGQVEVSNLPDVRTLRHDYGFVSRDPSTPVVFPNDIVLTDLVITRLDGSPSQFCEVALYERQDGQNELQGIQFFYPSAQNRTVELHLQSGLMPPAGEWGVALNTVDCVVKVLWSGYAVP